MSYSGDREGMELFIPIDFTGHLTDSGTAVHHRRSRLAVWESFQNKVMYVWKGLLEKYRKTQMVG